MAPGSLFTNPCIVLFCFFDRLSCQHRIGPGFSSITPLSSSPVQFLQRQKILGIYRDMLKTIRQVPSEADRKYLTDWARDEFKRNKNSTNQVREAVHTGRATLLDP